MKQRILIIAVAAALASVSLGAVAFAADLAEGDYEVTIPGVGTVIVTVAEDSVDVTTLPDGYTVTEDAEDDELEFTIVDAAGDDVAEIEVESDELKIETVGTALPGEHLFTVPEVGDFVIVIGADGNIESFSGPDGFTLDVDSDGEWTLRSEGGSVKVEVEIEDGVLELKVEFEDDDDDSSDDDDDSSDDDDDSSDDDSSDGGSDDDDSSDD